MKCPECGGKLTSRLALETEENEIYRKRPCPECGCVFHSIEFIVEETDDFVEEWERLRKAHVKHYNDKRKGIKRNRRKKKDGQTK